MRQCSNVLMGECGLNGMRECRDADGVRESENGGYGMHGWEAGMGCAKARRRDAGELE